jgi:hypothetical protein
MNKKDEEAFDEWRNKHVTRQDIHDAWQAALEYERERSKELVEWLSVVASYDIDGYDRDNIRKALGKYSEEG